MKRRTLLTMGALSSVLAPVLSPLGRPAIAQASKTLIFVPQANLTSLDPIWTTATVTRNFAFLVYDTLYGVDAKLNPHQQMAAGHKTGDGGKRWTVTLRDGLKFHDNEPVRAADCAASLQRWMKRDAVGQIL